MKYFYPFSLFLSCLAGIMTGNILYSIYGILICIYGILAGLANNE